MDINFKTIEELNTAFPDEESCIKHLEMLRWNGYVVSPFDPSSKVYLCRNQRYRCKNSGKYFNVKTDTLFDHTKIPLQKWFIALWYFTSSLGHLKIVQLSQLINVSNKTAWTMLKDMSTCLGKDARKVY